MLSTGQKLRFLAYIIIVPILFFSFPIINQMLQKSPKEELSAPKPTKMVEGLKLLSSRDTVLSGDIGSNAWNPIDKTVQIKINSNLASIDDNGRLLVKTPDDLIIALGGKTKIAVSKYSDGNFLITPSYGCFGLKFDNPLGKEVNISFMSGVRKIKVTGQNTFCKNKREEELIETAADVFLEKDINVAKQPRPRNVSPCKDIIEVDDPSGSTASVLLKFIAPLTVNKSVLVSTNPEFTDTAFTAKTYSSDVKTSQLKKGQYFWKVKNESTGESSDVCSFEVVYHSDIALNSPKNNEVVTDNSIEFSWNGISGNSKYSLTITQDFSKLVQKIDVSANSAKIDDPIQTLGPGSYYWRVVTANGKVSPYRRFFVYTNNDIVVNSPRHEDVIRPYEEFFMVSWEPLPAVKSYSVIISSNPSFVSSDYANTTTQPFVYVEKMKEGKYYLKVSAVFENNTKIVTDVIPFSVFDIPEVDVLDPTPGSSKDVSTNKMMNVTWKFVDGASGYIVLANDSQPIKVEKERTVSSIPVNLGGNRVQVEAYCGVDAQRKLCAKSKAIEFFISNIIESPNPPVIKYPYSRKIFKGGQVSMEWSASKGANGYKLEISKDKDFVDSQATEVQTTKITSQLGRGIYYWRVSSYTDKTGTKIYSQATETRLFIIK